MRVSPSLRTSPALPWPLALLLLVIALAPVCGPSQPAPASGQPTPSRSAAARPPQAASATIAGIAHGGYDPDYVTCELFGSMSGMVFHGTLSGPHIGSNRFDVTSGQPSNGRTPVSPTDGIFALKFPGQGPLGPFTCTLTSVDVPPGTTLAPHQPNDWTLTVS